MNKLKKNFIATLLLLLIFVSPSYSSEQSGFTLTSESFLKRLSFAAARVPYGLATDTIRKDIRMSKSGDFIIAYNTALMLLIKQQNHSHVIENIAVTFFYNDSEPDKKDGYRLSQDNETVFKNICMQVIFSLHPGMKTAKAKEILNELGMQGKFLDGIQRSTVVDNHIYVARVQPNGVAVMLVLHN